ncbi:MAG: bifunctional (p)ppGpp synthetase/guanosine-3',5'-bis(diphosphate) 3'-pyrophosphohydrolase [Bacteroides sp.]|nr:bifunctional (p)ppGpp synthetase/guanosine-3',5'-bis(diphosphate) 3'-pyrophosphohydrolase [Bacteroides sp.]
METDYNAIIDERAGQVFEAMARRVSAEDLARIRAAFELAREAHASQKRKTGEPYILHPIAVANIAAEELMLEPNAVIACFLHDVVEDTDYTIEDIRRMFGEDVAFLVKVVTKKPTKDYEMSKQLDNYRQLLDSMQYDMRAILVKLADRLHNMRTLESMKPEKQMKIAGETDYFYAPLANRLGLYNIKTELENLSFRYRCPAEFEEISDLIARHVEHNRSNLETFRCQIEQTLAEAGIKARVYVDFRRPFSLWRKMKKYGDDFNHLKYRHFVEVVFDGGGCSPLLEKEMAMRIYCILTDRFKEKHCSMSNYIDSPKENGYQSIHVKLLPDFGRWQEVHISSESMTRQSQLGCVADRKEENLRRWIEKFRKVLRDTIGRSGGDASYMEDIITTFYNDDIQVFTPKGEKVILPQNSTVIDFAYEVHTALGDHAKYARINGRLDPVTTPLRRGDVVEIFTDPAIHPEPDWERFAHTYKAKKAIRRYREQLPTAPYRRCPRCRPMPGEEVIGIRSHGAHPDVTVHKRDCREAISMASSFGDDVVSVAFLPDATLYPVTLQVRAVDRHHLLIDLADCITNTLNLCMESFNTRTERNIVVCRIRLGVHSSAELKTIINHIAAIEGVDEVKRIDDDGPDK